MTTKNTATVKPVAVKSPKAKKTIDETIAGWAAKSVEDITFADVVRVIDESIAADEAGPVVEPMAIVTEVPLASVAEAFDEHDAKAEAESVKHRKTAEAMRAEAIAKMNTAKKATSAHAFALIACEGDVVTERLTAMRAKLAEWPAGIRAAACKLARTKAQPGSRTDELLKQLHGEQPAAEAAEKSMPSKSTDSTIIVRKNNEELIVRWLGADFIGRSFKQVRAVVDGKVVITLTEQ